MRKIYFNCIAAILSLTISFTILPGCNHRNEALKEQGENEEEHDEYDSPGAAAEFEYRRNIDPATGTVPHERMWQAVLETEALKNINSNSTSSNAALAPLTWIERGSNSDVVGPSNGNTRPGNGVTSGRMKAIWVDIADPTGNTVWVGGVWGGIWKTTNMTAATPTWVPTNDFLSNLVVTGICQDPTNPNTMYMATGETGLLASYSIVGIIRGDGVFKSTDHGLTWTQLPSSSTLTNCTKILCDATGNVYVSSVGISPALGLQRSTDGGATWVSINPFSGAATPTSRIVDFEISSLGVMHVVGGLSSGPGIGGYRYTATPATIGTAGWSSPTTPYTIPTGGGARVEIITSGNNIYAAISNADKIDNIGKSTDGGNNWTTTPITPTNVTALNGGGQGSFSNTIGIDPSDPNTIIVGSLNLLKSTDGGASFSKISEWVGTTGQYCHADQHAILWFDNGNKLLVGTDGGLFYSTNKGVTISDKNTGLRLKQFYGVTAHPTLPNNFLCGSQDNGTHQFNNVGLSNSIEVLGGDGGITGIDQDEPQFQAGTYVYANFRRSTNGGASWVSNGSGSTAGLFINPYDYDNAANKIYAGNVAGQFMRWENPHTGFTFSSVAISDFGTGQITSVTSSALTANRAYFGLTNGRVIRLDNADQATPTSTIITPAAMPATVYVTCVAESRVNTQNLIATTANYGVSNIYSTTNGGTNWAECDGNLPDMPVYWAVYHPDGDAKVYIATETGVWSTDLLNGVSTVWTPETTFPTVKTSMLKYRSGDRTLAAATYGRGLWTAIIPASCTPPSITSQPTNTSVCSGDNTSFTVTAAGTAPLSYQWQVSTAGAGGPWANLTNAAPYSGVTTNTLTITTATLAMNSYQYRVIVTGVCAPLTATSTSAILAVNAASFPAITGQPSNVTVCSGAGATFTVNATGAGLSYQWQVSTNGGGLFTNIGGAMTNALTLAGVTAAMNNNQYRVIITGGCPATNTTTSNAATLTVNTSTLAITSNPTATTVCAGSTATFTAAATGTGLTYQWQVSTNGGALYTDIFGATTTTLTLTGVTAVMNNNLYRLVVKGTGTCDPAAGVNSTGALLTVQTSPVITSQPTAVTGCPGSSATFSVTATGTNLTYQWQSSATGCGGTFTNIPGAQSASYNIPTTAIGMSGTGYRVIVSGTCTPAVTSDCVVLTVNSGITISAQPVSVTACAGSNATFSVTATGGTPVYRWQESTNGGTIFTDIPGATGNTLTLTGVTAAMNNNQYRVLISNACTPAITSDNVTLTVQTAAAITSQPTAVTTCTGTATSLSVTATGTNITYQWQSSSTCTGLFNNIPAAMGASYNAPTATAGTTAYRVVVSGVCTPSSVTSNCVTVTVVTTTVITNQPTAATVCAGNNASFSVTATGATTYLWQVSTNGGTSFTDVAGATSATLSLTAVTGAMNGNQYRVIINGCPAPLTSNNATLTVQSAAAITGQPADITSCATTATFSVTATGIGITYQWQVSTDGGTTYTNIAGAMGNSITLNNLTGGSSGNKYRVVVSSGTCGAPVTSNAVTAKVGTAPVVVLTAAPFTAYNPSITGGLYTTVSPAGVYTYQWTRDGVVLPNVTGPSITAANGLLFEFGAYKVTVTDPATGCAGVSNTVTITDVAGSRNQLFITPNPARDIVRISYYSTVTTAQARKINVYDSKGGKIMVKDFTVTGRYGTMNLDLSRFVQGTYMIIVRDAAGNKIASERIIIL